MTWYTFGGYPAYDPAAAQLVIDAVGQVFAVADTAFATPLQTYDLTNTPQAELRANSQGYLVQFRVENHPEVIWKSGGYKVPLQSFKGAFDLATAASTAATTAAAAATSAQAAMTTAIDEFTAQTLPPGGLPGQIPVKLSPADFDWGWANPPAGGGGGGGNVLIVADVDEIPPGTLARTLVVRIADDIPTPTEVTVHTGPADISTTGWGSSATLSPLAVPADAAVGDLLVLALASQASGTGGTWTLPAGWTVHYQSPSTPRRLAIATYPITGTAALSALASGVTLEQPTPGSYRIVAGISRVTGADLTNPVVGVTAIASGTTTEITLPALTTTDPVGAVITLVETNGSSGQPQADVTFAGLTRAIGYNWVSTATGGQTGIWTAWAPVNAASLIARTATSSPAAAAALAGIQLGIRKAA